jgi:hypothetical protein
MKTVLTTKNSWRGISGIGRKICRKRTQSWTDDSRKCRSICVKWWRKACYRQGSKSTFQFIKNSICNEQKMGR